MATKCVLILWFAFVVMKFLPLTVSESETSELKTLYFLTIQSYPDPNATIQPSWDGGIDIIPAAELAVELINNNSGMLPNYRLELINADGGCNILTKTVISFVDNVFVQQEKQPIVGIIGGSCSASSLILSPLTGREEVALINMHYGGSPALGNRELYPYAFGTLGSSQVLVDALFALMRKNDWKRIAILYDESRIFFSDAFNRLRSTLAAEIPGGEIVFSSPVFDSTLPIDDIRRQRVRLVLVFTGPEYARRVMCLAYHENALFPVYQWFLFSGEFSEFEEDVDFIYNGTRINCTRNVMANISMNGNVIVLNRLSTGDESSITDANITYRQFLQLYSQKVEEYNRNEDNPYRPISVSVWAPPFFDQVWTLALALNNSNLNLSNYRYGMQEITKVIREEIHSLEFDGVSGHIKFDSATGFSTRPVNIFQVSDGQAELVAYIEGGMIINASDPDFIFDEFNTTYGTVLPAVAALFTVLTVILLCLIVLVHIVTIVYRKHRSIRASSLKLNQLIFAGCYISVVAALLYEIHNAIPLRGLVADVLCHSTVAWLIPIGYTLIFGTITARTWRLYRIFTHYLDPGRLITNPVLFSFVFMLLAIDVIIAVVWTAVDPIRHEFDTNIEEHGEKGHVLVLVRYCTGSEHYTIWIGIVLVYKFLVLSVMVVLSLLTRNIYNRNFQTKSLRVMAYLLGILFVFCLSLYLILLLRRTNLHGAYSVFSFILNAVIFLCLSLVFVPPIIPLLKEKFGTQFTHRRKMNTPITHYHEQNTLFL